MKSWKIVVISVIASLGAILVLPVAIQQVSDIAYSIEMNQMVEEYGDTHVLIDGKWVPQDDPCTMSNNYQRCVSNREETLQRQQAMKENYERLNPDASVYSEARNWYLVDWVNNQDKPPAPVNYNDPEKKANSCANFKVRVDEIYDKYEEVKDTTPEIHQKYVDNIEWILNELIQEHEKTCGEYIR